MSLINFFFSIASQTNISMTIKFALESDGRKLFEHIGNYVDARRNID